MLGKCFKSLLCLLISCLIATPAWASHPADPGTVDASARLLRGDSGIENPVPDVLWLGGGPDRPVMVARGGGLGDCVGLTTDAGPGDGAGAGDGAEDSSGVPFGR